MKIKLKTEKYYTTRYLPCTLLWTDKDWEKIAIYRTEPKKIKCMGFVWRTLGERNAKGDLLYLRAEKEA